MTAPERSLRRFALVVACDTYDDQRFSQLRAPKQDVAALAEVFQDPEVGGFAVKSALNLPVHETNNLIADFFQERTPDDLALLYFSCHGVKDDSGRLYLAGRDTKLDRLRTSGIRASLLHEEMDDSRARQIVLLLDCCFSGAFEREMAPRSSERLDVAERLAGRGRVVITASSSTEYAFEDGARVVESPAPSFFTDAIVEGLRTGAADRDGDGLVSADELYFFVYDRVRERTAKQTPTRATSAGQGEIFLATTPRQLPEELQAALDTEDRWRKLALIEELHGHVRAGAGGLSTAARQALERLSDGVEGEISAAAQRPAAGAEKAPPPSDRRRGPRTSTGNSGHWFEADPLWFKTAVFYQLHVRAFFDANGDGSGDLRGVIEKLDYLQWLGIDCIWLLPFYKSPLRDGGYDISDFYSVHPDYGTVEDVRDLIEGAHQCGIRVIADLVMNHTSRDHPWFQESRSSPDNPKRDWYVWSETVHKYETARIIFAESEEYNWEWDEKAGAYFWHRFFSHQPDLNFDNPEVQEAMLEVLRFWLDLGMDGFHLAAAPYLYEREGTACENLPETHAYLARVVRMVEEEFDDRVLMVDALEWTESGTKLADSPGNLMVRHVTLAAALFGAIRRETREGVFDLLRRPAALRSANFALFLRDHDTLALDMVTAEERDYIFGEYVKDPRTKIDVGIRRRLAPLLDAGRDEIQLMHSIMFSLPGSPVLYYGDEIMMGDNVYLGDRDGVRTPMQWTGDRNGGFSRADSMQLYAPPVDDPVYGFRSVNVEAQLRTPRSLLRWLRRHISLRKEYPVLALGELLPLYPGNSRVLALVRTLEDDVPMLCVANLARSAQVADLDLSPWEQRIPVEVFGRVRFPPIGGRMYRLTLGPRAFMWFALTEPDAD